MKYKSFCGCAAAVLAGWAASVGAATVRVDGGAWHAASTLVAANFSLGAAGTLLGNGEIRAPAILAGTVQPGCVVGDGGTLSFSDQVTFNGGVFLCHAASVTTLNRISAAGSVSGSATVRMSRAAGATPLLQAIIRGGPSSVYSSFAVEPSGEWVLGQSGALDLLVSYGQLPPAPQGVTASDGRYADQVALSWSAASGAAGYQVWRNTANDSASASLLGTTSETNCTDAGAVAGQIYYFWIKSTNALGVGAFSQSDSGWRRTTGYSHYADTDLDGDGKADLVLFDPASGAWRAKLSSLNYAEVAGVLGGPDSTLVPGDYDGDRLTDPGAYTELTGLWTVMLSSMGYGQATATLGGLGYAPVPSDFDGDGKTDLGVYQAATGGWTVKLSASGYAEAGTTFGGAECLPVQRDYDGDRKADPAIYHLTNGNWRVMLSGSGYGIATAAGFGGDGYAPVPGDYDGDGKTDPGIYHESTGAWYVMLSGSGYLIATATLGGSGYAALPGDYDGDGKTDPGVYETATGRWAVMLSGSGYGMAMAVFGGEGYDPVGLVPE